MKIENRKFQVCSKCVLDTNDYPEIIFDKNGICNICHTYDEIAEKTLKNESESKVILEKQLNKIKKEGKNKEYDCLIGLSGGVDSSFLAYLAKQWNLRPLIVHVDNGWNSELSIKNIENIVKLLDFDLYTHVIDWVVMREVQLSFLKASVLDIEFPYDNAIQAVLYGVAKRNKIKYILSGVNTVTEGWMPSSFVHNKLDSINLRDICSKFGKKSIYSFPIIGPFDVFFYEKILGIRVLNLLNLITYNKKEVKDVLSKELAWRDYGAKHYENVFTRFYQGYILPVKFKIDKRKSHLSTLICSGQISRNQALIELEIPIYPKELLSEDFAFVLKKLDLNLIEFENIMDLPLKKHTDYKSLLNIYKNLSFIKRTIIFK